MRVDQVTDVISLSTDSHDHKILPIKKAFTELQSQTAIVTTHSKSILDLIIILQGLLGDSYKKLVEQFSQLTESAEGIQLCVEDQNKLIENKPHIHNFRPREIVEKVIKMYRNNSKNLNLVSQYDDDGPDLVSGDSAELIQILINFVVNAIKFTPSGGKITISLTVYKPDPSSRVALKFSVSDTGIGMTPQEVKKIFSIYAQASSDTHNKFGGTGIGLFKTKKSIEKTGGSISVESEVGKGSIFTFTVFCQSADHIFSPDHTALDSQEHILGAMHDLRNDTSGIEGHSEMIKTTISTLDTIIKQEFLSISVDSYTKFMKNFSKLRKSAATISIHTAHQRDLVTQTLDYSKLIAGKDELYITSFNLRKSVNDLIQILNKNFQGINIIFKFKRNITVAGDANKLTRILNNLLNSMICLIQLTGLITINLTFAKVGPQITLKFNITNRNITITEDQISQIFVPYFLTTTPFELSIAKNLIELMGGEITARREPEKGLAFSFSIACRTTSTTKNISSSVSMLPSLPAASAYALVVDDQKINRELIKRQLTQLGYKCHLAENGKEAVKQCEQFDFCLIIMDMQMPEMDGITATRHIRALEQQRKTTSPAYIIVLSGNNDSKNIEAATTAGANDYLTKPISPLILANKVSAIRKLEEKPIPIKDLCRSSSDNSRPVPQPLLKKTPLQRSTTEPSMGKRYSLQSSQKSPPMTPKSSLALSH